MDSVARTPIPSPMPTREVIFGPFRLIDGERRALEHAGQPVRLTPKLFDVLLVLIDRPRAAITRDELRHGAWPGVHVSEANVTQHVWMLRKALALADPGGDYIETVPGGYRFTAPVTVELALDARSPPEPVTRDTPRPAGTKHGAAGGRARALGLTWALLALIGASVGGGLAWRACRPHARPAATPAATSALPTPTSLQRRSVAVLRPRNLSDQPGDAWLATALAEMLGTELEVAPTLRLVPAETLLALAPELFAPPSSSLPREALERVRGYLRVDLVLAGTYLCLPAGGERGLRLDLRLYDVRSGEARAVVAQSARLDEVFDVVARAGEQLRRALDAGTPTPLDASGLQAAAPRTLSAARDYAEGLAHLRRYAAVEAAQRLGKAVEADPAFALAHAALASAWGALGYDERARRAARRAMDLSSALPRELRLRIEAQYHDSAREWPRAIELYRSLFVFFPDDLDHGLALARAQTQAGDAAAALSVIAELRRLRAPDGDDPRLDLAEAYAVRLQGDRPRAEQAALVAARKAESMGARQLRGVALLAAAAMAEDQGRYRDSQARAREARELLMAAGDRAGAARALNALGNAAASQGPLARARELYEQAYAVWRDVGHVEGQVVALNNIAGLALQAGDTRAARRLLREAADTAGRAEASERQSEALLNLATVAGLDDPLAAAQRLDEAAPLVARSGSQRVRIYHRTTAAQVAFDLGHLDQARSGLREALSLLQGSGAETQRAFALALECRYSLEAGELRDALRACGQAQATAARLDDPLAQAAAACAMGRLHFERGERPAARRDWEAALGAFRQVGERPSIAELLTLLAEEELERGDGALALARIEQAEHAYALPAAAHLRVRALRALHRPGDARRALASAQTARRFVPIRLRLEVDAALLDPPGDVAAIPRLRALVTEAERLGYRRTAWEAGLVLGAAERRADRAAEAGFARLAALARETEARGYARLAARARAWLADPPRPSF